LNKHAKAPSYSIGDLLLVRRHAYSAYGDRKWPEKFNGPYRVVQKISPVVYRVSLAVEQPEYTDLFHALYMRTWKQRGSEVIRGAETAADNSQEPTRWETFGGTPKSADQFIPNAEASYN
jgi:hypothetical protein